MVHNIQRWHDKRREVLEDAICLEFQREIRRAIAKVREAHEILSSLMVSHDNSTEDLLTGRANALGSNLTRTELEVISKFIEGQSPETKNEVGEDHQQPAEEGCLTRSIGEDHQQPAEDRMPQNGIQRQARTERLGGRRQRISSYPAAEGLEKEANLYMMYRTTTAP